MDRRTCLATIAGGFACLGAGCLGGGGDPGTVDGNDDRLAFPLFPPAYYDVEPSRPTGQMEVETAFADLSTAARLELATAVHRGRILTGESPALLDEERRAVRYRDERWNVRIGVADHFTEPEHGPAGDPDWRDPVTLSTDVTDGELTLSLTNALDTPLPVHYRFRPAFGVLVAVRETTTAVLDHEGYAASGHVRTDGVVRTDPGRPTDSDETIELSPGETLAETYTVPAAVTGEATIRPSIWIGGEGIDLLDDSRQLLTATVTRQF